MNMTLRPERRTWCGLVALLSFAMPVCAQSQPTFSVTNEGNYYYNKLAYEQGQEGDENGKKRPNQYRNTLNLNMNWGNFSAGIAGRYANVYLAEPITTLRTPALTLHRIWAKYTDESGFTLTGGDFNAVLGKGLALSVVENPAVLQERSIRGGEIAYRGERLEFRLLGGRVSNFQPRLYDPQQTPEQSKYKRWDVVGSELNAALGAGHWFGLRGSRIEYAALPNDMELVERRRMDTLAGSLYANNLAGMWDYCIELSQSYHRDKPEVSAQGLPTNTKGYGAYASLSFHKGPFMAMLEHKRYFNMDNALNNPPLVDRDTEEVYKTNNSGQRLLLQYNVLENLNVFGSIARYKDGHLNGSGMGENEHMGRGYYVGFKLDEWKDRFSSSATYGVKHYYHYGSFRERKTEATLGYRFTPATSADLLFHSKDLVDKNDAAAFFHNEWDLTAQLNVSPWGSIYVTRQYIHLGENNTSTEMNPFGINNLYSAGVRVNLPSYKTGLKGGTVSVLAGRMHGGKVCSGGMCQMMPAFSGMKVETLLRF